MYQALITKIKDTLDLVTEIKEYYAYPESKYTGYPAVIFTPSDLENNFETTNENKKIYQFTMFVIISLNNTTKQAVFETHMPTVIDAIIAQFDQDWDMGVIANHRIRALINAGSWGVEVAQDGEIAVAQLNLSVKTLTSNN